jgi:hypothetical protein
MYNNLNLNIYLLVFIAFQKLHTINVLEFKYLTTANISLSIQTKRDKRRQKITVTKTILQSSTKSHNKT